MIVGVIAVLAMIGAVVVTRVGRDGWAFVASAVATAALTSGWFLSLYPNVLPSSLDPAFSLNIENAASSPYTLTLMSWVALAFVPLILAYEAWSYWVFRKRISVQAHPRVADRAAGGAARRQRSSAAGSASGSARTGRRDGT